MNKTNIKGCRRMLEARRAELLSNQHDTEGIAIERVPDSMDEFSLEIQRRMAVDALNRRAALFRQVTESLERIAGENMARAWRVRRRSPPSAWLPCLGRLSVLSANKLRRRGWAPTPEKAWACGRDTA